jgi:hypothetical protein
LYLCSKLWTFAPVPLSRRSKCWMSPSSPAISTAPHAKPASVIASTKPPLRGANGRSPLPPVGTLRASVGLAAEQAPALGSVRRIGSPGEDNMASNRIDTCVDRSGGLDGGVVGMDAYLAEVDTAPWLHLGACCRAERLPGGLPDFVDGPRRVGGFQVGS